MNRARRVGIPALSDNSGALSAARKDVLDLDDFSREEIEGVLQNAEAMREILARSIRKVPALRGQTVITLFHEPSTRTRVSFEQAGKVLSADVINVTSSGSSVKKGESLYNTALTLQAMNADIIVVRHPHSGAPHFLARHLESSVINAGDGAHAHPSQALLDMYTIKEQLGGVEGKKVAIIGDLLYSRVGRSNLWGLLKMGAEVTICAPPTLVPADLLNPLPGDHPFKTVTVTHKIEEAIEGAEVVMALRLQLERQLSGHLPSLREYSRMYCVTPRRLELAAPNAIVMHPGPMNEGVEIHPDVAHGARSVIDQQVTNGVAVRMALLFGVLTPARRTSK